MNPLIAAILCGIAVFLGTAFVFMRLVGGKKVHTKNAIRQLMAETTGRSAMAEESIIRVDFSGNPALRIISSLPFGQGLGEKILHAGLEQKAGILLGLTIVLLIAAPIAVLRVDGGPMLAVGSVALVLYLVWWYLNRAVKKRNILFINDFPDVLDMIVRSVRSGFPLNTAINMVAENMEPPVSTEFRQVADEIALGRTLDDALTRLSQRVNEPDVHFFVVVLKVQQETGGNLAEVISNLSGIIRKRKQLRLKIRAITSEGRATGWILGSLPVVIFTIIEFIAPQHLQPMFETHTGHVLLGIAGGLIVATHVIVRRMTNVEI